MHNDALQHNMILVTVKELFDFFDPQRASERAHRREDRESFSEMIDRMENVNYMGDNYNSVPVLTALCAHNVPKPLIADVLKRNPDPFIKDQNGLTVLDVVKYFRPEQFATSNDELAQLLENYATAWQKRHKTNYPLYSPSPTVNKIAAVPTPRNREHMIVELMLREYTLGETSADEMIRVISGLENIDIINRYYNDISPLIGVCAYDVPGDVIGAVLRKNPDPYLKDCHGRTAQQIVENFRSPDREWKVTTPAP